MAKIYIVGEYKTTDIKVMTGYLLKALDHLVVDGSGCRHVADRNVDETSHRCADSVIKHSNENDEKLVSAAVVTLVDHQRVGPLFTQGRHVTIKDGGDRTLDDPRRLRPPTAELGCNVGALHCLRHHSFHQLGEMIRDGKRNVVFRKKIRKACLHCSNVSISRRLHKERANRMYTT